MTWWILPSWAVLVLANLWLRAGAKERLMGWKAGLRDAGRRMDCEALSAERVKPL
jgi:hypothetical protein